MNLNEQNTQNTNVNDEVVAAEAELRAAQETLEAARARLAELKGEHPAVQPGADSASSDVLVDELEVAAVMVDETGEVEGVVVEHVAVPVEDLASRVEANSALDEDDADEPVGEADADAKAASATAAGPAEGEVSEGSPTDSAAMPSTGAAASSAQSEPTPDWVPYTTAPVPGPASGSQPATPSGVPYTPPAPSAEPGPVPPASSQGYYQQPQQPYGGYAAPGYGQTPHAGPGAVPPQQPYYGYQQPYYQQPVIATKDHVAAGLLGIFLGALGIHKFYLGYNTAGFIMLAVTILGSLFTFGLAGGVMWVIGIIEGILYLTKSQSEFEQIYVVNKREWF
ncbi:TM2 domain-containing protein [Gordonibacter sp. 28C]|uniref:TM2 domain-containing protein n=1 Tax=Gordonibacter sp. 28C TaxID=2078569 RepID=UPI000DF8440C|nr:TM2 domain-containing protein [Gordonibacter sp. 28C]RDB61340.1 TM2 domain-containing protein [Gordonibacter sp. 28C]